MLFSVQLAVYLKHCSKLSLQLYIKFQFLKRPLTLQAPHSITPLTVNVIGYTVVSCFIADRDHIAPTVIAVDWGFSETAKS